MIRFLALFLACCAALAHAAPNFVPAGLPGPHAVGWRVVEQYDYTRDYRSGIDLLTGASAKSERARPIRTLVWYPAMPGGKPLSFSDYALTAGADDDFGASAQTRRHAMEDLIKSVNADITPAQSELELRQGMHAARDAVPAAGKFPVIIYAPSFAAPAMENADLCEYLASAGYVVIASASMGARTRGMSQDLDGIETQVADIRFLIGYAHTLEHADADQLAVMGYSWGGMANAFAAARDGRIKALVSLDGSVRYFPQLVESAKYLTPENLPLPFLFLAARPLEIEDLARYKINVSDSLIDKMVYSDTYVVTLHSMTHGDFASTSLRLNPDTEYGEYTRAEAAVGYQWMERYALHFFDAYLKHDQQGKSFLQRDAAQQGAPAHLLHVQVHASTGTPPSLAMLAQFAAEHGYDHLDEAMQAARKHKPDYQPLATELADWAGLLQGDRREADALAVLKLDVALNPDKFLGFHLLGDAYERNGDKVQAIGAYRHATELEPGDTDAAQRIKQLETPPVKN